MPGTNNIGPTKMMKLKTSKSNKETRTTVAIKMKTKTIIPKINLNTNPEGGSNDGNSPTKDTRHSQKSR